MDEPTRAAGPVLRFVPDRRYTALAAVGACGAVAAALVTGDPAGRVLFAVATAVLLGYVICDLVFSPRLTASVDGVVINAPLTRARLSWADVHTVRAETRVRRGLRTTTLEIDAETVLAVFSRRALGAQPAEAAARIEACRPQ